MRIVLLGAAIAAMATTAGASNDFLGQLSHRASIDELLVSGDNLTCKIEELNQGYIPTEWATATIKLLSSNATVLNHDLAEKFSTVGNTARRLCVLVADVKAHADSGGYIGATVTSHVEVRLNPRYGGGCNRDLIERVTVAFSNGLTLKSVGVRILGGGSEDQDTCF